MIMVIVESFMRIIIIVNIMNGERVAEGNNHDNDYVLKIYMNTIIIILSDAIIIILRDV